MKKHQRIPKKVIMIYEQQNGASYYKANETLLQEQLGEKDIS